MFIVLLYWCVTCRWCIWLDGWVVGGVFGWLLIFMWFMISCLAVCVTLNLGIMVLLWCGVLGWFGVVLVVGFCVRVTVCG